MKSAEMVPAQGRAAALRQLPNFLTAIRLALVPWLVLCIATRADRLAVGLCVAAGLTDALDGFLARRFQWQTPLGAYLDPIADKALLTGVYFALAWSGAFSWWVVLLVVGRDAIILLAVAIVMFVFGWRGFPPSPLGKLSTILQILTAVLFLASRIFPTGRLLALCSLFLYSMAAVTTLSALDYARRGVRRIDGRAREG